MQSSFTTPTWIIIIAIFTILCNIVPWKTHPVSPAILIYSWPDASIPIALSPFLVLTLPSVIARLLQFLWLAARPPSPRTAPSYLAATYGAVLALRSATGFLLSRSVGWKYPHLFNHASLYEPIAGIGPLLVGSLLFEGTPGAKRDLLGRLAIVVAFAALDELPWTYICGVAIAGLYHLAQSFMDGKVTGYALLPWHVSSPDPQNGGTSYRDASYIPPMRIVFLTLTTMTLSALSGNTGHFLALYRPLSPPTPSDFHIIMLTVPRQKDLDSDIMIDSILSYIGLWPADTNSTLTVYAHLGPDGNHPAFERARADLGGAKAPLKFYIEPSVGRPVMNHHAHLADAMRFAYKAGYRWTMFVEDDFLLCGQWGWDNLMRVMTTLNEDLDHKKYNGAFVATGGSGVVFHRSLLPALEQLLTMEVSLDSQGAKHVHMPPDVLMQKCLSGEIPFCPNPGWVISSRLLMGHHGGALSTGNRIYEEGKWACGWRHPQHGNKGADVVVTV